MKNIVLSILILCFSCAHALAQTYAQSKSIGTKAPYDYAQAGTNVLGPNANQTLSTWQTLPFSFEFFGTPVTGYFVSDNGYLTFDASATVSESNNTVVPYPASPRNAIFAYWDDLKVDVGGSVRSWTYGPTGNRVHVIQWYNMVPGSGNGLIYFAVRLYECGDFDVVLNDNFFFTSGSGTVGCQNATGTLGASPLGSPNLPFPNVGEFGFDDEVYSFYYNGIGYDMTVKSIDLGRAVPYQGTPLSFKVQNRGAEVVTSYQISYSVNGGPVQTHDVSNVFMPRPASNLGSTTATLDLSPAGEIKTICAWVSDINGGMTDERPCNDTLCSDHLSVLGVSGPKHVLLEEYSGAWCQFCPDGEVVVELIKSMHEEDVIPLTIHGGDDMEYPGGTDIVDFFDVSSWPAGQIDRFYFDGQDKVPVSRTNWESYTLSRLNGYTPVNIALWHTYDPVTKVVGGNIGAEFVDYADGNNLRVHLFIIEDSVSGTGSGYNQVNFYNTSPGHPYFGAGNPIVGYQHRRVLRANPFGLHGSNPGIVPGSIIPEGAVYNVPFGIPLDPSWNPDRISIVAFVAESNPANALENTVLTAVHQELGDPSTTAIGQDLEGNAIFGVSPNPVNGIGYVHIGFDSPTPASVEIFDLTGRKVATLKKATFTAGEHRVYFETSGLPAGVYYVSVTTAGQRLTEKIMVTK